MDCQIEDITEWAEDPEIIAERCWGRSVDVTGAESLDGVFVVPKRLEHIIWEEMGV